MLQKYLQAVIPKPKQRPFSSKTLLWIPKVKQVHHILSGGFQFSASPSLRANMDSRGITELVIAKQRDLGNVQPLTLPFTFRRAENRSPFHKENCFH